MANAGLASPKTCPVPEAASGFSRFITHPNLHFPWHLPSNSRRLAGGEETLRGYRRQQRQPGNSRTASAERTAARSSSPSYFFHLLLVPLADRVLPGDARRVAQRSCSHTLPRHRPISRGRRRPSLCGKGPGSGRFPSRSPGRHHPLPRRDPSWLPPPRDSRPSCPPRHEREGREGRREGREGRKEGRKEATGAERSRAPWKSQRAAGHLHPAASIPGEREREPFPHPAPGRHQGTRGTLCTDSKGTDAAQIQRRECRAEPCPRHLHISPMRSPAAKP